MQGTWSRTRTLRNLEVSPEHPASSPTTAGRAGRISRKRPCCSCLLFGLSLAGAWHGKCPLLMVGARAARTQRGAGATRRVKPKRELKSPREPPGSGNPAAASGRAGCRECRSRRRRTSPETGVRPAAQAQTRRACSSTRQQNLWPTIQIFSPVASRAAWDAWEQRQGTTEEEADCRRGVVAAVVCRGVRASSLRPFRPRSLEAGFCSRLEGEVEKLRCS